MGPGKGCVKTFDDETIFWMMTEDIRFSAIDQAAAAPDTQTESRPDPSNLQVSAGEGGLINNQDSIRNYDLKTATERDYNDGNIHDHHQQAQLAMLLVQKPPPSHVCPRS
jgi:hypothetical protein